MHHFVNDRPADLPLAYKQLLYDLYANYKVKSGSVLPFAMMHLETRDFSGYEIKLHSHDMRTVSFQDDSAIVTQLTLELNHFFT